MLTLDSFNKENTSGGSHDKATAASIIMPINSTRESVGMRFIKRVVSTGGSQPSPIPHTAEKSRVGRPLCCGPVNTMDAKVVTMMHPTSQIIADLTGLCSRTVVKAPK